MELVVGVSASHEKRGRRWYLPPWWVLPTSLIPKLYVWPGSSWAGRWADQWAAVQVSFFSFFSILPYFPFLFSVLLYSIWIWIWFGWYWV
jgi:hypothetical protein